VALGNGFALEISTEGDIYIHPRFVVRRRGKHRTRDVRKPLGVPKECVSVRALNASTNRVSECRAKTNSHNHIIEFDRERRSPYFVPHISEIFAAQQHGGRRGAYERASCVQCKQLGRARSILKRSAPATSFARAARNRIYESLIGPLCIPDVEGCAMQANVTATLVNQVPYSAGRI
jgi:hypothetical protein